MEETLREILAADEETFEALESRYLETPGGDKALCNEKRHWETLTQGDMLRDTDAGERATGKSGC